MGADQKSKTQKVVLLGQLTSYGIVRSSWNGNDTLMCAGSFGTVRRWIKSAWDVTDVCDNMEKCAGLVNLFCIGSKDDPFEHSM